MKSQLITFFLLFCINSFAQPGPFGGMLSFKVYNNGKKINLPNENWKITPTNITLADSANTGRFYFPDKNEGFYNIIPAPTPAGGSVKDDFYLDIVFKKDTMRIYPPSFRHQDIELDSIPFQKGVYKIPQSVYDFKKISKKGTYYGKHLVPNLYGDWNLFAKETYKCYIEKVEDLDYVLNDNAVYGGEEKYNFSRHWQNLYITPIGTNYYFNDNVIVAYNYSSEATTIYEVKDFSNNHYWYSGKPSVRSLFYKNNQLFAIIYKGTESCGIYKLHFIDEEAKENLKYLEKKQVIEEYEAEIKLLETRYKQNAGYREREKYQATEKFNQIMKTFEK